MSRDLVILLGWGERLDSSAGIVSVREWDLWCFCTEIGLPVLALAGLVADRPVEGTGSDKSSATKMGGMSCAGCSERWPERPRARDCSRVGIDLELEILSLVYLKADLVWRTLSDENASTSVVSW